MQETSILGRAEWIKYLAPFYNLELEAGRAFEQIRGDVETLTDQARATDSRPVVAFTSYSCDSGSAGACTGTETFSISTAPYKVAAVQMAGGFMRSVDDSTYSGLAQSPYSFNTYVFRSGWGVTLTKEELANGRKRGNTYVFISGWGVTFTKGRRGVDKWEEKGGGEGCGSVDELWLTLVLVLVVPLVMWRSSWLSSRQLQVQQLGPLERTEAQGQPRLFQGQDRGCGCPRRRDLLLYKLGGNHQQGAGVPQPDDRRHDVQLHRHQEGLPRGQDRRPQLK
jgi:hypothetical protein